MSLPEEGVEKRTASPATAPPQITPVIKDLAFDIKGDLLIFVRIHDVKNMHIFLICAMHKQSSLSILGEETSHAEFDDFREVACYVLRLLIVSLFHTICNCTCDVL